MEASSKRQLVAIPEFIDFEFHPQQELHAFIDIENLTDQIISYRIKTTAPAEYLVKPMQGQIYIKEKAKIIFKRKKLSLENFQAIQNGTKTLKQKFMFVITCKSRNAIGMEKVEQESKIANVRFIQGKRQVIEGLAIKEGSPLKKVKSIKTEQQKSKYTELVAKIEEEKDKLQELTRQRVSEQAKFEGLLIQLKQDQSKVGSVQLPLLSNVVSVSRLTRENIICLVLICLLLGMWI